MYEYNYVERYVLFPRALFFGLKGERDEKVTPLHPRVFFLPTNIHIPL